MTDLVERVQSDIAASDDWRADVRDRYALFIEADAVALTDTAHALRSLGLNVPATLTAFIREIGTSAAYIRSGGAFGEEIAELRMRLRKELFS